MQTETSRSSAPCGIPPRVVVDITSSVCLRVEPIASNHSLPRDVVGRSNRRSPAAIAGGSDVSNVWMVCRTTWRSVVQVGEAPFDHRVQRGRNINLAGRMVRLQARIGGDPHV